MGSPVFSRIARWPQQALDTIAAPATALEGRFPEIASMLGIHPQEQPAQQADPNMVRAANQSFVDAMNRQKAQPKPVRGGK